MWPQIGLTNFLTMARSINTIYQLIIAEKESRTELDGLTSNSVTAIWRLWAWVTAAVLYTIESMWDLFKVEIETILQSLKPGTLLWYKETVKAFQYGDALVWSDGHYIYATIDATKCIVAQCSVTEGNGGLVIKVAREVSGELQPLTLVQQSALQAYISQIKYAGTKVSLVNSNANLLRISATVYYDPLVLGPDGTDLSDATKPVELAISSYLRNLPFNGRLKRTAMESAILAVEGVADVKITLLKQKYGSGSYADIDVSHVPESGYFKIDPSYPVNGGLTYTANV